MFLLGLPPISNSKLHFSEEFKVNASHTSYYLPTVSFIGMATLLWRHDCNWHKNKIAAFRQKWVNATHCTFGKSQVSSIFISFNFRSNAVQVLILAMTSSPRTCEKTNCSQYLAAFRLQADNNNRVLRGIYKSKLHDGMSAENNNRVLRGVYKSKLHGKSLALWTLQVEFADAIMQNVKIWLFTVQKSWVQSKRNLVHRRGLQVCKDS